MYSLTMNKCDNNNNNNNNQNLNPLNHLNNVSSIHSDAGSNGGNSSIIKYLEPEPLLKVEKFFIEFFLASKKQDDIFYCPKENMMPKYFNMDIVKIINSISSSKETSLEDIMYQIEQKVMKLEPVKNNGNINLQIVTGHKKKKEPSKLDKLFNINYKTLLTDLLEHKIEGNKKEENGKCLSSVSNKCCVVKQQGTSDKNNKNELRHIHSFTPFGKHSLQEIHKCKTGIVTGSESEMYFAKDKITLKNNDNTLLNGNENDMTSLSGSKWDNFSKDNITLNLSRKLSEIKVNGIVNGISDKEVQSGGAGNFWNTRKISFIDDFRNDNTRLDEDLNYSPNRRNHNIKYFAENSEEALIIKDKPLIPRKLYQTCCLHYKDNLIPQHNKGEVQNIKELQHSTVKNRTKFTSLMLGGLYRKDVAVNKLFIPEDHADFGKQLTFHKDT